MDYRNGNDVLLVELVVEYGALTDIALITPSQLREWMFT